MALWPPHNGKIGCVLHEDRFSIRLQTPAGENVHLRRLHVCDLRDEAAGRLSIAGYEAVSVAFCALDAMTPSERFTALCADGDAGYRLLNVFATDIDAVVAISVHEIAGRKRFVACIRDMFGQGARSREWWRDKIGRPCTSSRDVQWKRQ